MVISAKSILLILFLYEALVWTLSWYRTPDKLVENGLWFTIVGLAVLLFLVLASWAAGVWKAMSARRAARPKPAATPKPQAPINDDDAALRKLLVEAAARLKTSAKFANRDVDEAQIFSGMPMYLIVGLEGAGKSSIMASSGLNLELLAGQGRFDKYSPAATGLANIWLAGETVFVEMGGRHFAGNERRWEELLRILSSKPRLPLWRRLWQGDLPGFDLRGIVHCCDVRFFLTKPGPEQIERQSQLVQERLRTALKVFGRRFPVYTILTKADQIPYFRDFFGRFSDREANEILGTTLPRRSDAIGSDQAAYVTEETKRVSKSLHALYTSLTERRLSVLFHETVDAKKPKIYEFPRELYRIRKLVADFLAQIFRPSPLEPSPFNRGFYFSGTREVEQLAATTDSTPSVIDFNTIAAGSMDATSVFRGDQPASRISANEPEGTVRFRRGALQTQWLFLSSLFQDVVTRDQSSETISTAPSRRVQNQRSAALVAALAFMVILAVLWTNSWLRNRNLIAAVQDAASLKSAASTTQELPTLEELKSLDAFRARVAELATYEREGAPYLMSLGLYSESKLNQPARAKYFRQLKSELLDLSNQRIARTLLNLPPANTPDSPQSGVVANHLKAYMMTAAPGSCSVEGELVSKEFLGALRSAGLRDGDPRFEVAALQLDFYARELRFGHPVALNMDPAAKDAGVRYLNTFGNPSQYYETLLSSVDHKLGGPLRLTSLVSNYRDVMTGPSEIRAAYSPAGRDEFKSAIDSGKGMPANDECIARLLSDGPRPASLDDDTKHQIEDLYARSYLEEWRRFLREFQVPAYGSAQEAAKKLRIFASYNSPLLGLFKFSSDNTDLSPRASDEAEGVAKSIQEWIRKYGPKKMEAPPPEVRFTPADVANAFQPVHAVVPPESPRWINEKNKPYADALLGLAESMEAIDNSKALDSDVYKQAEAAAQKAKAAVAQVAAEFEPMSVGGLNDIAKALLEKPVVAAEGLIKRGPTPGGVFNPRLQTFCTEFGSIARKYPLTRSATSELSLAEFSAWFAPKSGLVWKAALPELVVQDGKQWVPKPESPARPSTELLGFLNKAQQITTAFFSDGTPKPHLIYTLRPRQGISGDQVIHLELDGVTHEFTASAIRQRDFDWPAASENNQRAMGLSGTRSGRAAFSVQSGPWAVFKMFRDADARSLGDRSLRWSTTRGPSGEAGPIEPPVNLEFVGETFDVFNPGFWADLRCSTRATQ